MSETYARELHSPAFGAGLEGVMDLVERKTYNPIRLRIKISFIWTTIKISDFHSGGITDEMLTFPKEQYKDYVFVDKR